MATAYGGFQLGLLPERKINKRAVAAAYGLVALALLIVINLELLVPERLQLRQYHVTELIPMPSLRPEPAPDQGRCRNQAQASSRSKAPGL